MVTAKDIATYVLYVGLVPLLAFGIAGIVSAIMILCGFTSLPNNLKMVIGVGVLLLIGGIVLLPGSILGGLGAYKESSTLLRIMAVPMAVALFSAVVAFILLKYTDCEKDVRPRLEKALNNYNSSKDDQQYWKSVQRDYKCCGIDGYGDWESNGISLPRSCCVKNSSPKARDENESCKASGKGLTYVYKNGCDSAVVNSQKLFKYICILAQSIFFVVLVITMIAAYVIIYSILERFVWY